MMEIISKAIELSNTYGNFLVPYDGSKRADKTCTTAISIAKKLQAKLTILACIEKKATLGFFSTKSDKKDTQKIEIMIKKQFLSLEKLAKKSNIKIKSEIIASDLASKCIISYAKKYKIDLLIISKSKKISPASIYHESTVKFIDEKLGCSILMVK